MSTRSDRPTLLAQLRPTGVVDTAWPPLLRDAMLARILEAEQDPPTTRKKAVAPGKRRMLIATAAAAVLIPSGVGVAAAEGLLSSSLISQLAWWTTETDGSVNAQNARRVAQGPGPDPTTVLTVWSSTGENGTTCTAAMFETPGALNRPADEAPDFASGSCPTAEQQARSTFGDLGGEADDQGIHTMITPAGRASRAELQLADGTVRAVVASDHDFAFWYRADRDVPAPVLVGYDRSGGVVARVQLPNLITNTH